MGRQEKPLDGDREALVELAAALRALRAAQGNPPYRTLAARVHVAPSTLSAAASGNRLPTWVALSAFLRACGVTDDTEWRARWNRLSGRDAPLAAGPNPGPPPVRRGRPVAPRTPYERQASGRSPGVRVPDTPTSFVGRADDLRRVHELLSAGRMVTLTGLGGVGKTRLAQQTARSAALRHRDGARWVELAEVSAPESVANQVLAALGEVPVPGVPPLAGLVALLRDRDLLLVLDNCEHLIPATGRLIDAVLRGAPDITFLTTSRHPLGVGGECLCAVAPLPVTADRGGALDLLWARARSVRPDLRWGAADRESARQICRRLDGVPLSMEIAARRLRFLSPAQLLERLDSGLHDLGNANPAAPPRHASLRAVLDWSHRLCSPDEQWAWAAFSVFSGQVPVEAAEAVCAPVPVRAPAASRSAVLDSLAGLVDHSILTAVRTADGEHRLMMPETVREYGRTLLDGRGGAELAARRHLDWWAGFARSARERWHGPGQAELIRAVRAELAGLRRAHEYGLTESRDPAAVRVAAGMVADLWWHCVAVGSLDEGRRWMTRALHRTIDASAGGASAADSSAGGASTADSPAADSPAVRAGRAGDIHDAVECDDTRVCEDTRVPVTRTLPVEGTAPAPDPPAPTPAGVRTRLMWMRAYLDAMRGDADAALKGAVRAAGRARRSGDPCALGWSLLVQGLSLLMRGQPDRAVALTERSLGLFRTEGNAEGLQHALSQLGTAYWQAGDADRARTHLTDAAAAAARTGEEWHRGYILWSLALLLLARGEPAEARATLAEALTGRERFPDRRTPVALLDALAQCALAERRGLREAAVLLAASAAIWPASEALLFGYEGLIERRSACRAALRRALGERVFDAAVTEGATLTPAQAVGRAVRHCLSPTG
ncbi:ATP-binding protein [Streptomyces sp. NPDC015032]|uniref:ATP-binding protein n=1 Tax=Streptomyces sp. NPDC015032 TaxID=3364937 RepID=UPI003703427C